MAYDDTINTAGAQDWSYDPNTGELTSKSIPLLVSSRARTSCWLTLFSVLTQLPFRNHQVVPYRPSLRGTGIRMRLSS